MNTILKNPYYFVKNNVIFEISTNNTKEDPCGKHYKTFDTETVELKKGRYYFDKNGNRKLAEQDGSFEVSLGTAKETETINKNKAVFPYFDITYTYEESGNTETITYWLDDLISDGDEMNGSKFQNKTIHTEDGETTLTYIEFFKQECLKHMANDVVNGLTLEALKSNNPFLFVGAKTKINGAKATVTATTIEATDAEIMNVVKEKIKEYGDKVLKIFDKECEITVN